MVGSFPCMEDMMKSKSARTRLLIFIIVVVVGFIVLDQGLEKHCPKGPVQLNINSPINSPVEIQGLYPWPGARIPFACHIRDFLKSPFAPKLMGLNEEVYKDDGFRVLERYQRRGVVTARIFAKGEFVPVLTPSTPGTVRKMPPLANSISFYVDNKKLNIGHVGWMVLDVQFNFATILNPFLLPGKHTGKILLQLPSGETQKYEWQFQITWW